MDLSKYHLNYATIKRRGYDGNYQYIYTLHSYPVRAAGFDDIDYLKSVNERFCSRVSDEGYLRFEASLLRSRSKVMQLGFNNRWDYFVTLTLDESKIDRYDYKGVVNVLLKFFDNYKQRRSKNFKYLIIPEQHKDGAWHFHGFFANIAPVDLVTNKYGYIDFVPYVKRFGYCSLSEVRDPERCASYITKYVTKDMFLNTPEPRTHLYFASRGLKYDEVISVGTASSDVGDLSGFCCSRNIFCSKYVSKDNVFMPYVMPFVNRNTAPEFPSADNMRYFKLHTLYDFCNNNGIFINDKTDLDRLYTALKDEIVDNILFDYDFLKKHYYDIRAYKDEINKQCADIFGLASLNAELVFDYEPPRPINTLQDVPSADDQTLHLPEPVIQLSLFDDEEGSQ